MKNKILMLFLYIRLIYAKTTIKTVIIAEVDQLEVAIWAGAAFKNAESKYPDLDISDSLVTYDRNNEDESYSKLCSSVSQSVNLVFDFTWSKWDSANNLLEKWSIPHVKSRTSPMMLIFKPMMDLLLARNATDVMFIFQDEIDMDTTFYNSVSEYPIKIMAINGLSRDNLMLLTNTRPIPGHYVIIGDNKFLEDTFNIMKNKYLLKQAERWVLVATDFENVDTSILENGVTLLHMDKIWVCQLATSTDDCELDKNFNIQSTLMGKVIEDALMEFLEIVKVSPFAPVKVSCKSSSSVNNTNMAIRNMFYENLKDNVKSHSSDLYWDIESMEISMVRNYHVYVKDEFQMINIGTWNVENGFHDDFSSKIKPFKTYLRIGVTPLAPWTMYKIDPETGAPMLTPSGEPVYEGFCIDMIEKISELMNFDYEIVQPKVGTFGRKISDGKWTGLIGDLITGEIDVAVAALITTSEREEVIDFVTPYFYEESGITIVMRKPAPNTSLFQFLTVLKVEVWLCIIFSITFTSVLLTIMERFSPFSAINQNERYSSSRKFSIIESFWLSFSSFTPQGGGEVPKPLSSRILVTTYWIFALLMLSTFTANLAAFLSVDSSSPPVSSLEQLGRQSRIKYSVVENSPTHKYFINMHGAEELLYTMWKEVVLNASSDKTIYQVWDYPIKEQYSEMLRAINSSPPVKTVEEGFQKVDAAINVDYAFLHNIVEIKYELSKNCNLTEVGEMFGERPHAVAVQQGSRLLWDLALSLLELQKQKFFVDLATKYWGTSDCEESGSSEGISLQSLSGVFLSTLLGLIISIICLICEIVSYKRKAKGLNIDNKTPVKSKIRKIISEKLLNKSQSGELMRRNIILGDPSRPESEKSGTKISFINIDPKIAWNP